MNAEAADFTWESGKGMESPSKNNPHVKLFMSEMSRRLYEVLNFQCCEHCSITDIYYLFFHFFPLGNQ